MGSKRNLDGSGARENPGRVKTGLSRTVLLTLAEGPLSIQGILAELGPRVGIVNHGTLWSILERATGNGLVRSSRSDDPPKRPFLYSLTEGGLRRVAWIRRQKTKVRPRAVANPKESNEEE